MPLQVDWEANKTTVVLNLSTTCHFCSESTGFYRRLVQAKGPNNFKLVAVFPQTQEEAQKYLDSHQIKVDQIISSSLASIGVTGTPTVLLVSKGGLVFASWRGKLDENGEAEVLSKISG
ncbi:MAG: peroxiredoxin family protein [Pyrinomonadaceae bacterium]